MAGYVKYTPLSRPYFRSSGIRIGIVVGNDSLTGAGLVLLPAIGPRGHPVGDTPSLAVLAPMIKFHCTTEQVPAVARSVWYCIASIRNMYHVIRAPPPGPRPRVVSAASLAESHVADVIDLGWKF